MRQNLANSNGKIVAPGLDVANHANVDVDLVVNHRCYAIFDVIDQDDHGGCLFQLNLVDVDIVGIRISWSNEMLSNNCIVVVVGHVSLHEVVIDLLIQLLDVEVLAVFPLFSRVVVVPCCLFGVYFAFSHIDVAFYPVDVPFHPVDAALDATVVNS